MRIYRLVCLLSLVLPRVAFGQAEFGAPDGARVPGAVLECATSNPTVAEPCGIGSAPLKIDQGSAASNPPAGGNGMLGFVAGIYSAISSGLVVGGTVSVSNLPATQPVSGSLQTSDTGAAVRGVSMPTGGSGLTGWLSAIWSTLSGTLSVAIANFPTIQNISGSVTVSNLPAIQAVGGTVTASPANALVSDCSTNIVVSGTPYQVVSSGSARKSVLLQNLSNGNVGFSLTNATPAIGAPGTFTLVPNASVQLAAGLITSNAIYAIGASGSQALACAVFQ